MTDIPAELDLAGAGLDYMEMDPFSVAVYADGRRVRFFRPLDATVDSIAEESGAEVQAYRRFLDRSLPIVRTVLPAIRGDISVKVLPRQVVVNLVRAMRPQPLATARDPISPYGALLRRWLASDLTRRPVVAFWQAAYHLFGQWHGRGGAQNLTDALVARLRSLGGQLRCSSPVARIEAPGGQVRAVVLDSDERIRASRIITAMDPKTALLHLLDPPLGGDAGADLAAARRSNVVQSVVHVATDRLPAYPGSADGDWNGLQSYVDRLDDLTTAWVQAEVGRLPDPLPLYAFTPSAIDTTLAPPRHPTVYLACPAAPSRIEGGWLARREEFVERCLDTVEARAPGFRASVRGVATWTPEEMERVERWPGGHPMYLDTALDKLGLFRPTKRPGRWRTPVEGIYLSGAGANPSGGIAGTPGRQAARALLADAR